MLESAKNYRSPTAELVAAAGIARLGDDMLPSTLAGAKRLIGGAAGDAPEGLIRGCCMGGVNAELAVNAELPAGLTAGGGTLGSTLG